MKKGLSRFAGFLMKAVALCFALSFGAAAALAGDKSGVKDDLSIGAHCYLSYMAELDPDGVGDNRFQVKRSYLTVKKTLIPHLGFRITLDAHHDDEGDLKVRLKYLYGHLKFDKLGFITKPNVEFGQAHTPWLDFEEHINYYRMQGKMFMERNGLFNSAGFGLTAQGYFGGELDDEYKKKVNKKYPGRYGSFAFGLYNGGGYHAKELNTNKTFQCRLTARPLPEALPGLRFSYLGIFGKGNSDVADSLPDWTSAAGMVSYEHEYFTIAGQYVSGRGNQKGTYADADHSAIDYDGYSIFIEGKFDENWRAIANYDKFDLDGDFEGRSNQRFIVGLAYNFGNHNILILDFDKKIHEDDSIDDENVVKLTMQVHF